MWQLTMALVGEFLYSHLLMSGLGGVITVVVGGIASVIAWRNLKRSAPRPAPSRQAPPIRASAAPPVRYAEPAPPTSPARRLHPGPIAFSPSTSRANPERAEDDDREPAANLFEPDLGASAPTPEASVTPPVWPSSSAIIAESRAQQPPATELESIPAPVWTSAVTSAGSLPCPTAEAPLDVAMEPPVWSASLLSGRLRLASAPAEPADTLTASAQPLAAPVWPRRPSADAMPPSEFALAEADDEASGAPVVIEPPVWPSLLRRPT